MTSVLRGCLHNITSPSWLAGRCKAVMEPIRNDIVYANLTAYNAIIADIARGEAEFNSWSNRIMLAVRFAYYVTWEAVFILGGPENIFVGLFSESIQANQTVQAKTSKCGAQDRYGSKKGRLIQIVNKCDESSKSTGGGSLNSLWKN